MVSLDDAVIARLEKGGNRYEILVDPELVTKWKDNPESINFEEMLATDEVWSDVKSGDRPTEDALVNIFGTTELRTCVEKILTDGSIQLTTAQRKKMVSDKRKQIIHAISSTATDPKTRGPHPPIRIEHALDEARFSVDPFLSVERQVADAVQAIRSLIPLQFITVRLAFRVSGKDYGGVNKLLRDMIQKEEWLENGSWACIVECPGGMKSDLISKVAKRSSGLDVKELD